MRVVLTTVKLSDSEPSRTLCTLTKLLPFTVIVAPTLAELGDIPLMVGAGAAITKFDNVEELPSEFERVIGPLSAFRGTFTVIRVAEIDGRLAFAPP